MACREVICAFVFAASLSLGPSVAQEVDTKATKIAAPAEALQAGIQNRLQHGLAQLGQGRRSEAVAALDEVHRLLGIAVHHENRAGAYDATALRVNEVRRLIQNGRPEMATIRLRETAEAFAEAPRLSVKKRPNLKRLTGATLLNSHGEVLGELEVGEDGEVVGVVGDWRDTLGFIDLNGTEVILPSEMLIAGPQRVLGRTFVMVGTSGNQDEILDGFRAN